MTKAVPLKGLRMVGLALLFGHVTACKKSERLDGTFERAPNIKALQFITSSVPEEGELAPSVARKFFEEFDSDVETLIVVPHREGQYSLPGGGLLTGYRLLESGTGTVDIGGLLVGPETFRGVILLSRKEYLAGGPFIHEFAHQWGAFLEGKAGQLTSQANPGHWGFASVEGVLGGWDAGTLETLDTDTYRVQNLSLGGFAANTFPYAPLELYLMGLLAPGDVPPIKVAVDPKLTHEADTFTASAIETLTIEDIIEANGPRQPAFGEASTTFSVTLIVLTDRELSEEEWDFYQRSIQFHESGEATFLDELVPLEQFPDEQEAWDVFLPEEGSDHLPFLNFHESTRGLGQLRFVVPGEM